MNPHGNSNNRSTQTSFISPLISLSLSAHLIAAAPAISDKPEPNQPPMAIIRRPTEQKPPASRNAEVNATIKEFSIPANSDLARFLESTADSSESDTSINPRAHGR